METAEPDIVKKLANQSSITTSDDSFKVNLMFGENRTHLINDLLIRNGVRLIYPIKKYNGESSVVAFVSWQNIENLAQSDEVSYIYINRME